MKSLPPTFRRLLLSLLISGTVWMVFSWPLAKHYTHGIPSSSTNTEKYGARTLIKGDQLQLNYFFWLFSDMVRGKTPWFHNLYEFNTGEDADRYRIGNYNVPFSLVYIIWDRLGSRAFAWNMTLFTMLWLTYWLTWLYVRRLTQREWLSAAAALISITLPFRYIAMMGGSPMGLAMVWPAVIVLGLDLAVQRRTAWGGLLAAAGLYATFWNDTRVFYFSVLTSPAWCLFGLLRVAPDIRKRAAYWGRTALRLLPFALVVLWMVWTGMQVKEKHFSDTNISSGRDIAEVARFSPTADSLFAWKAYGKQAHAYLGWGVAGMTAAGLAAMLWLLWRRRERQTRIHLLIASICLLMALAVIGLALGPHGPADGLLYRGARAHLPSYNLIRMTVQAYCILPHIMAALLGLLLWAVAEALRGWKRTGLLIAGVAALLLVIDHGAQVRTTVCLLPDEQPAYRAIAEHAEQQHHDKRALIIPLWPGDSDWSSIYQYCVSLYRIRMINGYSPIVREEYMRDIFSRFGDFNTGTISNESLDVLTERHNTRYIVIHEDAFPEKVSPFPVVFTIRRLLNHPRLELLARHENVWTFYIHPEPLQKAPALEDLSTFFATLHWEFEYEETNANIGEEPAASGNRYRRMTPDAGAMSCRPFKPWQANDAKLLVRVRGTGSLQFRETDAEPAVQIEVNNSDWFWLYVPLRHHRTYEETTPGFSVAAGAIDMDCMLYMAGPWNPPEPEETLILPAALFFHAGWLDMQTRGVHLRKTHEPDDRIIYGPMLPLHAGRYEISAPYETDAPDGTLLGELRVRLRHGKFTTARVIAGEPAVIHLNHNDNLLLRIEFDYSRNADVEIRRFEIKHLDD